MDYSPDKLEWLFRTLNRMHHHAIRNEFDRRALAQASHPPILFALRNASEAAPVSQKELAQRLGISPPTVAVSVRRMEKAGLICKIRDEADQRYWYIRLTEKGERLIDECEEAFLKIDESLFSGFTDEEREQLRTFYLRMIKNLEAAGITPPDPLKKG